MNNRPTFPKIPITNRFDQTHKPREDNISWYTWPQPSLKAELTNLCKFRDTCKVFYSLSLIGRLYWSGIWQGLQLNYKHSTCMLQWDLIVCSKYDPTRFNNQHNWEGPCERKSISSHLDSNSEIGKDNFNMTKCSKYEHPITLHVNSDSETWKLTSSWFIITNWMSRFTM